ncbi:DUF2786 domain-containing protein [Marinomonas atlantica]|uniref:DUF2786 domain-containing protein n=1 Tax=Marinomonas atlantica TaxID=1806668 RepID=UPI00082D9FDB|nr:DUF2786 domain-containing protein [Marinomonas atlantica]
MSMDSRYKEKIRKLLALSQSDNEHEAEAAKRQAKKLMAKYHINADELDIVTINARPLVRKGTKEYENSLICAIERISGCYAIIRAKRTCGKWGRVIEFTGLERDAELAAYSFDVLLQQVEEARKTFVKKVDRSAKAADLYCEGWMDTATCKLVNVFGRRERPVSVEKNMGKRYPDIKSANIRSVSLGVVFGGGEYLNLGCQDGEHANLNVAAGDQREPQLQIGGVQ